MNTTSGARSQANCPSKQTAKAKPVNRTVRIFLSSTFRDFGDERDPLVRKMFTAGQ